jgi:phosphatidylglycerophosphate synthase
MGNVPNLLTLLRLALIPFMAYFACSGEYAIALPIFLVAALSDLADGTVMASGIQYVSRWGRMAFAERRRAP